jgi:cytochrome P450/NADPH-cytochrome P450 reductase
MAEPITGPPGLPLLGNLNDIDPGDSMSSLSRLADTYGIYFPSIGRRSIALTFWHAGPIFKLNLGGEDKLFISTHELMNEVCDEKRFSKTVSGPLAQIRNGVEDGLFTAYPGEHNWEIAHRVLMPGTLHIIIWQKKADMVQHLDLYQSVACSTKCMTLLPSW